MPALVKQDTAEDKRKAERALRSLKGRLKKWLKVRKRMDDYAAGKSQAPALFRNPGAKPLPPALVSASLRRERLGDEQRLAELIHGLLVECGADAGSLPIANVSLDPDAAVKLAQIAIKGKTPSEASAQQGQGIVWFVLAIPVAGVVLVLSQMIQSKADIAIAKEERRCKESGACTDEGFWLKMASIAVVGWLAWDKFGLREAVNKRKKK
jgi:hypothetical protein